MSVEKANGLYESLKDSFDNSAVDRLLDRVVESLMDAYNSQLSMAHLPNRSPWNCVDLAVTHSAVDGFFHLLEHKDGNEYDVLEHRQVSELVHLFAVDLLKALRSEESTSTQEVPNWEILEVYRTIANVRKAMVKQGREINLKVVV